MSESRLYQRRKDEKVNIDVTDHELEEFNELLGNLTTDQVSRRAAPLPPVPTLYEHVGLRKDIAPPLPKRK